MENWGDMSDDEMYLPPGLAPERARTHGASTKKTSEDDDVVEPGKYMYAKPIVCHECQKNMLTTVAAQRFAKLEYEVNKANMALITRHKDQNTSCGRAACAQCRSTPSKNNIQYAFMQLLVRIGTGWHAMDTNSNYPDSQYKDEWYAAHAARANKYYDTLHDLLATVNRDVASINERVGAAQLFHEQIAEMNAPLPRLKQTRHGFY